MSFCPRCRRAHVGAPLHPHPWTRKPPTVSADASIPLMVANAGLSTASPFIKPKGVVTIWYAQNVGDVVPKALRIDAPGLAVTSVQLSHGKSRTEILPSDTSGRTSAYDVGKGDVPLSLPPGYAWRASTPGQYAYQDQILAIQFQNIGAAPIAPKGVVLY